MYALAIGPLTASALKCGEDNMLRTPQLLFHGLLYVSNGMQQESENILQKTFSVVWIMWSTVCHLATKHDNDKVISHVCYLWVKG